MLKPFLALAAFASLAMSVAAETSTPPYEEAVICEDYLGRISIQAEYGSDAYKQMAALEKSWRRTAELSAPSGTDLAQIKADASRAFWDIAQNGTGAERQAYHQSFARCATPPALAEIDIPEETCAAFALYLTENADSSRNSWQSRLMTLDAQEASEDEVAEAQAKLAKLNENADRAKRIYRAYMKDHTSARVEADTYRIHDQEERSQFLDACEAN